MQENIVIALTQCKALIQGLLRFIALLVNELSAYLVRRSNMTDGLRTSKRLDAVSW